MVAASDRGGRLAASRELGVGDEVQSIDQRLQKAVRVGGLDQTFYGDRVGADVREDAAALGDFRRARIDHDDRGRQIFVENQQRGAEGRGGDDQESQTDAQQVAP